ncbi:MAG: membrane dipeptidase [Ardenticatenaceae bacterium]|nr:membrane dipeptidase [Ardenticatenaceae bacterium]MCB8991137.1 membrane dipeptidase [Ardenticatenaceae bacterium]MCB9005293.1 membrane dipeptidase [Ardenticatenaceae bacterium]
MDATQLHRDSIIIDGLNASWFFSDAVIERIHAGGITAVNATISAWHKPDEALEMIRQMKQQVEKHGRIATQVRSVADIHAAKTAGKTGFIFGFQDTNPIADRLELLKTYYDLGVRIIQLTYNFENLVGFGCQAPEDKGLTAFGKEVVAEMNRLGLLIDVSHCGPQTTLDAIELSDGPIAITHANAITQFAHPRNKTDEAIKACAAKGGVIGAVSFPAMLTNNLPAKVEDYVAAIDYLVQLVGPDHVALGPDFMEEMPKEVSAAVLQGLPVDVATFMQEMPPVQNFASAAETGNVTAALLANGYSAADTQKIMGGNWLRLYEQVWK